MSGTAAIAGDIDSESKRFADTLVTAYTCDLLGYGVDYIGIADHGHETRERIMAEGATYDEAMERIRRDVTNKRDVFNSRYYSAIYRTRFVGQPPDAFEGGGQQQRFQKTFTDRCNTLAEREDTAALFTKPEKRMSSADVSRRVREMVVLARHGE